MRCALIGTIGSGKSAVRSLLRQMGKQTCDCDVVARELEKDPAYLAEIDRAFGCVQGDRIDRARLRKTVFSDPERLARLNAITHPAIKKRLEEIVSVGGDWFVEVSAYRGGILEGWFDRVLCVTCDTEERVRRVMARSGMSEQEVRQIIAAQPAQSELEALADVCVDNGLSIEATRIHLIDALNRLDAEDKKDV